MRIIAGQFRSRRLRTPDDALTTRPTPDRLRESIFNLLRGHVQGQRVIDAFAGTGAMGLEALSQGADECVFVEQNRRIARLLQSNIDELDVADRAQLIVGDALAASTLSVAPRPVHLIFFDPPYAMIENPLSRQRCLTQLGRFIQLLDDAGYALLRTPRQLDGVDLTAPEDPENPTILRIPGALGPESHAHGGMAIHLYMKENQADSDGREGD